MLKEGKGPSKLDIKKVRRAKKEGLVPGFVLPVETEPEIVEIPEPIVENRLDKQLHDVMQRLNSLTDKVEEIKDEKKKNELLKLIDDRCAKLKLYEREADGEKTTTLLGDFETLVYDVEEKLKEIGDEIVAVDGIPEDKIKLVAYKEFSKEINLLQTKEALLEYLSSLGKFKLRNEKLSRDEKSVSNEEYYFPAFSNRVKEVFIGNLSVTKLRDIPALYDKVREIMEGKEKKISPEEFKEKYKDVWKKNLFDEKREKWMYIQDYDEEKGAWVRFGEGTKYLKPDHIPLDELDVLLLKYKNKEEKTKKEDSAGREDEIKSVEKQMEEADGKVYKEYADKFYLKLSDEKTVNWEGYTAKQKAETLNIQTLVFLQKELSQNPKYKDRAEKLAREIFESK